jgi:iron complex outermembrane receptor protein
VEVLTGLGGPLYGPAYPSGMFNFVTKRPTEAWLGEIELDYEGSRVGTAHTDLSGRLARTKCSASAPICC